MPKKEIITTTREQQQRYLMNCAAIAVFAKARAWEPRINNLSFLLALRENSSDLLKEKFGQDIMDRICECRNAVSEIIAYFSDIKNEVINKEDVSSQRFLCYKESLSVCYKHLFMIDSILVFLQKGTDLEELTIPSLYWNYLTKEEIKMPPESIFDEQSRYNKEVEDEPSEE